MYGEPVLIEGTNLLARAVQHETDHLDGVLFFDRMKSFETLTYLEEYSRYHTGRSGDDGDEDDE